MEVMRQRFAAREHVQHITGLGARTPGHRVGESVTAATLADDAAAPQIAVDVGSALLIAQRWLRNANVMELGDFLRDMGHVQFARDVETVFGAQVCVCGGTRAWCMPCVVGHDHTSTPPHEPVNRFSIRYPTATHARAHGQTHAQARIALSPCECVSRCFCFLCVFAGQPQLWGQMSCYCAPFRRHAYWAGYVLVGASTWMSTSGGRRLQKGRLFPNPEDKDKADGSGHGAGRATGPPADTMATYGTVAIRR